MTIYLEIFSYQSMQIVLNSFSAVHYSTLLVDVPEFMQPLYYMTFYVVITNILKLQTTLQ